MNIGDIDKLEIIKIFIVITFLLIALNIRSILFYTTGSETPIAVVKGYSMFPLLREGDIVFAYKPKPADIREGEVIIYRSIDGKLIIHRVVEVVIKDNRYYYITKGDNNPVPDYAEFRGPGVPYERVEGVVIEMNNAVFKIPYLGYLSLWFHGN
ncbi:MAG: signal peptidase I [Staphylothermus sp.]|nr:signal peptidase I [Staphylothermus sp.]